MWSFSCHSISRFIYLIPFNYSILRTVISRSYISTCGLKHSMLKHVVAYVVAYVEACWSSDQSWINQSPHATKFDATARAQAWRADAPSWTKRHINIIYIYIYVLYIYIYVHYVSIRCGGGPNFGCYWCYKCDSEYIIFKPMPNNVNVVNLQLDHFYDAKWPAALVVLWMSAFTWVKCCLGQPDLDQHGCSSIPIEMRAEDVQPLGNRKPNKMT